MDRDDEPHSAWWSAINVAVLLLSAALVVHPPLRHLKAFRILYGLVLMPAYLFASYRRIRAQGTGRLAIGELHDQVRRGRRLPKDTLHTAAVAMMLLAAFVQWWSLDGSP